MKKIRADELLCQQTVDLSRSKAKALILAGKALLGTQRIEKPGQLLSPDNQLRLILPPQYVSRGAEKIATYLEQYPLEIYDKNILDVGASTGGFTDYLLQHGATHATCIDVGRNQLHPRLQSDPRVTNIERCNARYLEQVTLPFQQYPIVVMDLSFISIRKVLISVWKRVRTGGHLITLVKPQFEAKKREVDKGRGIVRDPEIQQRILIEVQNFIENHLFAASLTKIVKSKITGTDGNQEYLLGIKKNST